MNKVILRSLTGLVLLCLLLGSLACGAKKYPSGRDTRESYGDGTYQLLRDSKETLSLHSCEYGVSVIADVAAIQEEGSKVYAIGEGEGASCGTVFAVVDLRDNSLWVCPVEGSAASAAGLRAHLMQMIADQAAVVSDSPAELPEEDRRILEQMMQSTSAG